MVWIARNLISWKSNGKYLTAGRLQAHLTVGHVFTTNKSSACWQKNGYESFERDEEAHSKAEVSIFPPGGHHMQTNIFHIKSFDLSKKLFLWVRLVHRQADRRCFICWKPWKNHLARHANLHFNLSVNLGFASVTTAHAVFR